MATRNGSLHIIAIIDNYYRQLLHTNAECFELSCVPWQALNMLFQSMLPRPTESSDDAFLASMTLHLATVPVPIGGGCREWKNHRHVGSLSGHGPVRLLDGIRLESPN